MEESIINSYKEVEDLNMFSAVSLKKYRYERLEAQKNVVNFLSSNQSQKIGLLDIGSGSSSLAYALLNRNLLKFADCVEPSKNRFDFSEKWKKDDGYYLVKNNNIDIMGFTQKKSYYDIVLIVDNTFSCMGLYYNDEDLKIILRNLYFSLKKNGKLIIEVSLFTDFIEQIKASTQNKVQEFELGDSIGLWEYSLHSENIMHIKSKYVNKDFVKKEKEEYSKIYNKNKLITLMANSGFENIECFQNFKKQEYMAEFSEKLVMICAK